MFMATRAGVMTRKSGQKSSDQWRILATASSAANWGEVSYFQIAELELYESSAASGTNVAVNGTATASSNYGSSFLPTAANDANGNTGWSSAQNTCNGEWLQITFSVARPIRSTRIYRRPGYENLFPTAFVIQAYIGGNWATVSSHTFTANSGNPLTYEVQ